MNARIFFVAAVTAAFLAGCGNEEFGDLKEELKDLTKDMRGKVAALPVVKPYEPIPYEAESLADLCFDPSCAALPQPSSADLASPPPHAPPVLRPGM